jgi:hypothetical protein
VRLEPGVVLGERGLVDVDADVAVGRAADQPRFLETEAAAVMQPAHSAQHHAPVVQACCAALFCRRRRHWPGAEQQQFDTIEVDRIANPQHRHPPHRTAVDVQAARSIAQLQPDAATVDADLGNRGSRILHVNGQAGPAFGIPADRMHALAQHQVGAITEGEPKSEGIHAAAI